MLVTIGKFIINFSAVNYFQLDRDGVTLVFSGGHSKQFFEEDAAQIRELLATMERAANLQAHGIVAAPTMH